MNQRRTRGSSNKSCRSMGSDNLKLTIDERRVNRRDFQQQGLAKTANFTSQAIKICKSGSRAKYQARSRKRKKRVNATITHFQLPPTKNFLAMSEEIGDDAQIQKTFPLAWSNGRMRRSRHSYIRRLRREAMETRGCIGTNLERAIGSDGCPRSIPPVES